MNSNETFVLVKEELERLDPALRGRETEDDYRVGVVLIAAYWVTGSDIDDLTIFTGYDRDFIAQISLRMRKAALRVILNKHRRSAGWNDYNRIRMASRLKEVF